MLIDEICEFLSLQDLTANELALLTRRERGAIYRAIKMYGLHRVVCVGHAQNNLKLFSLYKPPLSERLLTMRFASTRPVNGAM